MAREKIYANNAARAKAHRERNNLKQMSVDLPADLVEQFNEWLRFKELSKAAVIEKLLRTQLLRKR